MSSEMKAAQVCQLQRLRAHPKLPPFPAPHRSIIISKRFVIDYPPPPFAMVAPPEVPVLPYFFLAVMDGRLPPPFLSGAEVLSESCFVACVDWGRAFPGSRCDRVGLECRG